MICGTPETRPTISVGCLWFSEPAALASLLPLPGTRRANPNARGLFCCHGNTSAVEYLRADAEQGLASCVTIVMREPDELTYRYVAEGLTNEHSRSGFP
jgi:hypothetical protein